MNLAIPRTVVAALVVQALFGSTPTHGRSPGVEPSEACDDFSAGYYANLQWTFQDCVDVWTQYSSTIEDVFVPRKPEVDMWKDTASELRAEGSPCMLTSVAGGDGLGSTTIRHVATWIFAHEMGCDWVTPDWGRRKVPQGDGNGVMYCHAVVSKEEIKSAKNATELRAMRRCSVVDWLSFFQFDKTSVSWPANGSVKVIQAVKRSLVPGISAVQQELETTGLANREWEHLVFKIGATTAGHHLVNLGGWDRSKRYITRNILEQMRRNFHRHPRTWYPEDPQCMYDQSRLHFAVHVRLGDRLEFAAQNPEYFERLENVMATISQQVELKGLAAPLFHVFSETILPCPSEKTGRFDEFPAWSLAADQVAACSSAEPAIGIFRVVDKPIMLHVDQDVQNAMSCMIRADGILMGCSTFGQIAGLLSRGISMFSTQCGGERTPQQYRAMPPLAVSEKGHMWVPITGSWYDPLLTATDIFRKALNTHLDARGIPG